MNAKIVTVTLNPALDRTCYVDGFTEGSLNKISGTGMDAGGKGINVARSLRNFGINALATGFMGGAQGTLLESLLDQQGILHDFYRVSGQTRTNIKIADIKSGITTELNEPGFSISEAESKGFMEKLENLLGGIDYLVLSGSLPKGLETDIYGKLIRKYGCEGVKVILDADNEPLKLGAAAKPFALKPNLAEMSRLIGRELTTDEEVADEARKIVQTGIQLVAVTLGSRGIILVNQEKAIKATPFAITPICTTGAGDSSLAALVYALVNGKSLEETAAFMTCTGTLSASIEGTGTTKLEDVEKNVHRIQLTELD